MFVILTCKCNSLICFLPCLLSECLNNFKNVAAYIKSLNIYTVSVYYYYYYLGIHYLAVRKCKDFCLDDNKKYKANISKAQIEKE